MRAFLDSSALSKRYVVEQGSQAIESLVAPENGHVIFIAQITPVEVMSAITRLGRDGVIAAQAVTNLRTVIESETANEYEVIALPDAIVSRAIDMLEFHSLRAYDAVQLASALDANARLVAAGLSSLTFVCADKRLIEAARKEGLVVEAPA